MLLGLLADEPWKHVKYNKLDRKAQIFHDFIYMKLSVLGKSTETESRTEVTKGWGEGEWRAIV